MKKSKHIKREEADARNEYWASLSYEQQLSELAKRPGKCKSQIAKINERMKKDAA